MKRLFLFLSQLLVFVGSSGLLQAEAVAAVPDTLNLYVIDKQMVSQFDGSQLVGKIVAVYRISTVVSDRGVIRIHDIQTEGTDTGSLRVVSPRPADPAYVVDGKQVLKDEFERLNPSRIHSISIIKNGSREDVKKYAGWENGVILVTTKKEVGPSMETADNDHMKVITIRKTNDKK